MAALAGVSPVNAALWRRLTISSRSSVFGPLIRKDNYGSTPKYVEKISSPDASKIDHSDFHHPFAHLRPSSSLAMIFYTFRFLDLKVARLPLNRVEWQP